MAECGAAVLGDQCVDFKTAEGAEGAEGREDVPLRSTDTRSVASRGDWARCDPWAQGPRRRGLAFGEELADQGFVALAGVEGAEAA